MGAGLQVVYSQIILPLPPKHPPPQYKDRVDPRLIKPAVDWRKAGVADATNKAAVAAQ